MRREICGGYEGHGEDSQRRNEETKDERRDLEVDPFRWTPWSGTECAKESLRDRGLRVGRNRVIRLMRAEQLMGRSTAVLDHHDDRPVDGAGSESPQPTIYHRTSQCGLGGGHDRPANPVRLGLSRGALGPLFAARRGLGPRHHARDPPRPHCLAPGRGAPPDGPRGCTTRIAGPSTQRGVHAALQAQRVRCSMSGRGNCYDNAHCGMIHVPCPPKRIKINL